MYAFRTNGERVLMLDPDGKEFEFRSDISVKRREQEEPRMVWELGPYFERIEQREKEGFCS